MTDVVSRGLPDLSAIVTVPLKELLRNVFLGFLLDWALMGVFMVQVTSYLRGVSSTQARTTVYAIAILLVLNIIQSVTNTIVQTTLLNCIFDDSPGHCFVYYMKSPVVVTSRLCGVICTSICQGLLLRQCIVFARTIAQTSRHWLNVFAVVLWGSAGFSFLAALASVISAEHLGEQTASGQTFAQLAREPDITNFLYTLQFVSSMIVDILFAITMIFQLRMSRKLSNGANRIVDGMAQILLLNAIVLVTFQISLCVVHLVPRLITASLIGIIATGKVYSVTTLLAISRPLQISRSITLESPTQRNQSLPEPDINRTSTISNKLKETIKRIRGQAQDEPDLEEEQNLGFFEALKADEERRRRPTQVESKSRSTAQYALAPDLPLCLEVAYQGEAREGDVDS